MAAPAARHADPFDYCRLRGCRFQYPGGRIRSERAVGKSAALRSSGPTCSPTTSMPKCSANLRARSQSEIAEALLNQRVLAGLGNVYKSEVLFMCGINPFKPVGLVSDADLTSVVDASRRVLKTNDRRGSS